MMMINCAACPAGSAVSLLPANNIKSHLRDAAHS
jgi:hypothetical protein